MCLKALLWLCQEDLSTESTIQPFRFTLWDYPSAMHMADSPVFHGLGHGKYLKLLMLNGFCASR